MGDVGRQIKATLELHACEQANGDLIIYSTGVKRKSSCGERGTKKKMNLVQAYRFYRLSANPAPPVAQPPECEGPALRP